MMTFSDGFKTTVTTLPLILLFTMGCAGSRVSKGECEFSTDCPANQICRDGRCLSTTDGGICAANERAINGRCEPVVCECQSDDDCGGDRCVDCSCYARTCQDEQTRPCQTECGGDQICRNGVWLPCRQSEPERCGDSVDNDCDGETDEDCTCTDGQIRPCSNECGGGQEECTNGQFSNCSAPQPRPEVCGNEIDENCDGQLDDGCGCSMEGEMRLCVTACGEGTEVCDGVRFTNCSAQSPSDEICDGIDNDCDGDIDNQLTRNCANICGPGTETCTNGLWAGCDAPSECKCRDGDIDNQICSVNEEQQCGTRERTCTGEQWSAWSECQPREGACAPGTVVVDNCSTGCGTERRVCSATCEWSVSPCTGSGECSPNDLRTSTNTDACFGTPEVCSESCVWVSQLTPGGEEDSCLTPGEEESVPCGNCGMKRRTCLPCYRWSEWTDCMGEPPEACEPGTTELRSCSGGPCATQERVCQNDCSWSDFGSCTGSGECAPGDSKQAPCGLCGSQTQTCSDACIWENVGVCSGEGVCDPSDPTGDSETASCADALASQGVCGSGRTTRSCNPDTCQWSNWGACSVSPTAEVCGNQLDEDCDGDVERRPDTYEPNDTCNSCIELNTRQNRDIDTEIFARFDSYSDINDYFCFWADDGPSIPFIADENIVTELLNVPSNADYDLYLYQGIGGDTATENRQNAVANCNSHVYLNDEDENTGIPTEGYNGRGSAERVDWSERIPGNDSGFYIVRVRKLSGHSCTSDYRLTIKGLK